MATQKENKVVTLKLFEPVLKGLVGSTENLALLKAEATTVDAGKVVIANKGTYFNFYKVVKTITDLKIDNLDSYITAGDILPLEQSTVYNLKLDGNKIKYTQGGEVKEITLPEGATVEDANGATKGIVSIDQIKELIKGGLDVETTAANKANFKKSLKVTIKDIINVGGTEGIKDELNAAITHQDISGKADKTALNGLFKGAKLQGQKLIFTRIDGDSTQELEVDFADFITELNLGTLFKDVKMENNVLKFYKNDGNDDVDKEITLTMPEATPEAAESTSGKISFAKVKELADGQITSALNNKGYLDGTAVNGAIDAKLNPVTERIDGIDTKIANIESLVKSVTLTDAGLVITANDASGTQTTITTATLKEKLGIPEATPDAAENTAGKISFAKVKELTRGIFGQDITNLKNAVIKSGVYNKTEKKIKLTKEDDSVVEIDVTDLTYETATESDIFQ